MTPINGPHVRRARRYALELRVELPHGTGVTRDVSAIGVFFFTDRPYIVGTAIDFTIVFEEANPDAPMKVRCRGQVVRVEPSDERVGVAATIGSYNLATAGSAHSHN